MSEKIALEIVALDEGISSSNSYTLLLREQTGKKQFMVIIGFSEAQAIATSLEKNFKQTRPLTHDLFFSISSTFNIKVLEVIITDVKQGIFYSTVTCKKGDLIVDFDSRTSDAIALALRFNAPIYIYKKLLDSIGFSNEKNEHKTIQEFQEELEEELKEIANLSEEELQQLTEKEKDYSLNTLVELKNMLQSALENENYELAARLRDEIEKRK